MGSTAVNRLCREGDTWLVSYEGHAVRLRDAKGVRDLAVLLARPSVEIHAADLVIAAERNERGHGLNARLAGEAEVTVARCEVAGVAVDSQARGEYRQRVADLRDEIAEADRLLNRERAAQL